MLNQSMATRYHVTTQKDNAYVFIFIIKYFSQLQTFSNLYGYQNTYVHNYVCMYVSATSGQVFAVAAAVRGCWQWLLACNSVFNTTSPSDYIK